jgi:two-component system cell cycle response regulator DivK
MNHMSNYHALIVDDNQKNVSILAQMLTMNGVSSTTVNSSRQLEESLPSLGRVDVIFLDLEMPGIDGYQIKDFLREDPRFDGVPIIAYTVHISEINVVQNLGFDGFLGKPLDADRFPEQLERILNGEPVWDK